MTLRLELGANVLIREVEDIGYLHNWSTDN